MSRERVSCLEQGAGLVLKRREGTGTGRGDQGGREMNPSGTLGGGSPRQGRLPLGVHLLCSRHCAMHFRRVEHLNSGEKVWPFGKGPVFETQT